MQSENDPLLILKGPLSKDVPKGFIPYLNTIRTQSQWEALGFNVRHDGSGNYKSIVQNGLYFGFKKIIKIDKLVQISAQSGKIYETYPPNFYHQINLFGCMFDDFAYISEDTKAYCNARLNLRDNDLQKAYAFIQEAIKLNSSQHEYHTLYFDICFALQDLSGIEKELNWYINDIDCMAHPGNIERWLKLLIKKGEYERAVDLMTKVNTLFDELIEGKRSHKRFSPQSTSFVRHSRESLWKRISK
ncbi:MAG: hypothetical protein JJE30_05975 [Desulfuromonadales bacterium]|nr:hypothetical protein [Desulfuromonadales bacterium]